MNFSSFNSWRTIGVYLGPLFFALYTSQISSYINHCKFHLYADDTQLYYSFNDRQIKLLIQVSSIFVFSDSHGLKLNPPKTSNFFSKPVQILSFQNSNTLICKAYFGSKQIYSCQSFLSFKLKKKLCETLI